MRAWVVAVAGAFVGLSQAACGGSTSCSETASCASAGEGGAQEGGVDATTDGSMHEGGASSSGSSGGPDGGSGCVIGGKAYAAGAADPTNACESCQPAVSTSTWSDVPDGTPCGGGGICHQGSCVSGCEIGGVYYATDAPDPNDPCQECEPPSATSTWTAVADGTGCGNGQVCSKGQCGTQCDIDGTVVPSGSLNPANACQSCQPGTSATAWTTLADGTSCGVSHACSGGTCVTGCTGSIVSWMQSQPAWEGDTLTAGTYVCSGSLPPGTTPSGQSATVSASGSSVTGSASFTCQSGTWVPSHQQCDGVVFSIPPTTAECSSTDPATTMFIHFYADDLYRCADVTGLTYWVGSYDEADGSGCPVDNYGDAAVGCWENVFTGGGTATEYMQAQSLGHVAPGPVLTLCGPDAGYLWSNSGADVLANGTQCKYLPP